MNLNEFIPWFPVLVIASHLPFLIRMDLKYRTVEYNAWIGMLPMIPITGYLYATGYYPLDAMWVSFAAVAIFFVAMKMHLFEGADFMLLMFIAMFFVVNPFSGRILMPIVVTEFLLMCFVIVNIFAFVFHKKVEKFPMIPVIAAAFALAVMLG